jgi:hypothetical protein
MQQVEVNQAQGTIQDAIGLAVFEDKGAVIGMLRKNGAKVNDDISDDKLIKVVYLAIAKSNGFKSDFSNYLKSKFSEEQVGYVEEDFFNQDGKPTKLERQKALQEKRKEQGGSKVGLALKKVATEENINALVNTGIGILSKKLTAKSDQASITAATELSAQKSQQALAEAQLQEQKSKSRKWVIPVVIGSVVVVGLIVYFVIRKKK